ncbi:MAG: hypothetical protein OEV45_09985 [Desulfobacteraceae bacterium]|nr:hypothetical protein [Desulfobacteraceae bacterium]
MDKIYFVEDIQSDRMNYGNELSEFDHDVASVSRSLLLELMDKNTVKGVEKRAHNRFQVNKDAFALIRPAAAEQIRVTDRSMAEIACAVYRSKPVRFGRINNISMGGLSFRYITGEERSNQSLVLDILVADSGFYLENLTFKNIADFEIADEFAINSFKMRLNRVQFEGLEPAAIMKLKHFVENYSVNTDRNENGRKEKKDSVFSQG